MRVTGVGKRSSLRCKDVEEDARNHQCQQGHDEDDDDKEGVEEELW